VAVTESEARDGLTLEVVLETEFETELEAAFEPRLEIGLETESAVGGAS
jgi:hypothetical protein